LAQPPNAVEVILGLGNPGQRYVHTRHNIGFDVVDELQRRRGQGGWLHRESCDVAVIAPGRLVVLAKPLEFMNRSGEVAARLLGELGVEPAAMVVVVDDIDLPLGAIRLRSRGGPGTHNGLRDLCDHLGREYSRLRIGVRGKSTGGNLADYVTSSFEEHEQSAARGAVSRAADALDFAVRQGFERAMNVFNRSA
jgi:PTH1 family peptidyl-tRNA hydrolase